MTNHSSNPSAQLPTISIDQLDAVTGGDDSVGFALGSAAASMAAALAPKPVLTPDTVPQRTGGPNYL